MSNLQFHIRQATPDDVDAILQLIVELATYEKEPDAVKNTPELLKQNLFSSIPYAHALLAFTGPASDSSATSTSDDANTTTTTTTTTASQGSSSVKPGQPIGLALYFFNYSTWTGRPGLYLEDLFVKPEYRSLGVGKAFFGHLGKIAQEKNCARMDWAVLKWNQPSIDFYEKRLGAKPMAEWVGMRLEEKGIEDLKSFLPSQE